MTYVEGKTRHLRTGGFKQFTEGIDKNKTSLPVSTFFQVPPKATVGEVHQPLDSVPKEEMNCKFNS